MTDRREASERRPTWRWLAVSAALLLVWNGRHIVPAASWLAPVFLVRFLRTQPLGRGLVVGVATMMAATVFCWSSIWPAPSWIYTLFPPLAGVIVFVPFALDRWAHSRLRSLGATLVLPAAMATSEYVAALLLPTGTWGAPAYTQFGNSALMQIVSITGVFGVTFLIGWFAAAVNWVWEGDFERSRIQQAVATFGASITLVLTAGWLRVHVAPAVEKTVRIASITADWAEYEAELFSATGFRRDLNAPALAMLRSKMGRSHEQLLALARREARAGASLVFWSEYDGLIFADDEAAFVERGRSVAREEGIYLIMGVYPIAPGQKLGAIKAIAIDPDGRVLASYTKARIAPGEPSIAGDGRLPIIDTAFGRVSIAICFDMDFPALIRQAGRAGTDIMIVPGYDPPNNAPLHTYMALVRGIENGMSVVRQTDRGLSAAADPQGRILATMDHFTTTDDRVMVARVPTSGVSTFYARFGNVFAWGCVLGLVAALVRLRIATRGGRPGQPEPSEADGKQALADY